MVNFQVELKSHLHCKNLNTLTNYIVYFYNSCKNIKLYSINLVSISKTYSVSPLCSLFNFSFCFVFSIKPKPLLISGIFDFIFNSIIKNFANLV